MFRIWRRHRSVVSRRGNYIKAHNSETCISRHMPGLFTVASVALKETQFHSTLTRACLHVVHETGFTHVDAHARTMSARTCTKRTHNMLRYVRGTHKRTPAPMHAHKRTRAHARTRAHTRADAHIRPHTYDSEMLNCKLVSAFR